MPHPCFGFSLSPFLSYIFGIKKRLSLQFLAVINYSRCYQLQYFQAFTNQLKQWHTYYHVSRHQFRPGRGLTRQGSI
jgi:hypothetical protein